MVESDHVRAAEPSPELRKVLLRWQRQQPNASTGPDLVLNACAAFASNDPGPDADPDPTAISWLVPGLGGHLRHDLASRFVGWLLSDYERQRGQRPPGATSEQLMTIWKYGFFVRCCQEVLPAELRL